MFCQIFVETVVLHDGLGNILAPLNNFLPTFSPSLI